MMLDPNCGYFNEERDDEYAPPYGECEECYRYDICLRAKTIKELLSGNVVNINFSELSNLISDFPDNINTLMIQKSSDGYCVVVDDISIRKERGRRMMCNMKANKNKLKNTTTFDLRKEIDLIDDELYDTMYPPSWARVKGLLEYKEELRAELNKR